MIWCESCQDHYEANHWKLELGDPNGHVMVHKTGVAYGHTGRAQAVENWARHVWDAGQLTPQLHREGTALFR
jgi:hypothetical protein